MQSREAKWFTRLILKDLSSLDLVEDMVYEHIDPRLRVALQMYDDVEAAITELRGLPASQMIDAGGGGFTQQCANDAHLLRPRIGIKIGPPKWVKAKGGVKHAIGMIGGQSMSVERKHDGEYCQIHIDLSRGEDCIQIFSKSGKDSTVDRCGVHEAIKKGLRIGRGDCGFSGKSILEGELLVWSEKTKTITDFHKIRKHVSRSGSFLGTTLDSQYVKQPPWKKLNANTCQTTSLGTTDDDVL
jgi:DNA ligase-4